MPKKKEGRKKIQLTKENPEAKRLMWIGVIIFSIMILLLWCWSMKIHFSNLSIERMPEQKLIQKTQADWNNLFKQTEEEQLKNIKRDINKYLQKITVATTNTIATSTTVTTTKN